MLVETRFLFKDETIYLRSEYYYNPQGKLFMERQNSDKINVCIRPTRLLGERSNLFARGAFLNRILIMR